MEGKYFFFINLQVKQPEDPPHICAIIFNILEIHSYLASHLSFNLRSMPSHLSCVWMNVKYVLIYTVDCLQVCSTVRGKNIHINGVDV